MTRLSKCMLCLGILIGSDYTVAEPSTQPVREAGLSMAIYQMPRVPRRVRKLLPGQLPVSVGTLETLQAKRETFHGFDHNIQAEIDGEILAEVEGDFTFEIESDDGLDLWLDGQRVATDAWVNGSSEPTVVTVPLSAGWHPMHIGFYQGDGGIHFEVRVKKPGADSFVDIPGEMLRHDVSEQKELNEFAAHPATTQSDTPWRTLYASGGFANLPEDDGDLLVDLLEGPTQISAAARKEWANLSKATNYDQLPYWHQTMVAAGVLKGWYFGQTHREFAGERAAYSLSQPEALDYDGWNGARRSGFITTMTLDNRTLKIYTPAADSAERINAADAIAGLPLYLRQYIKEIKTEPYGTASEFNGGGGTIWIRLRGPASTGTLDNVFAHETGHLLMNVTDCYNRWVEASAKDPLSVSHYGRQNPSEDFADFNRLLVSTNNDPEQLESLRTLYPNRMKLMEELVKQASTRH